MSSTQDQITSTAHVPTAESARYMKQLCRHFAHRVPAVFDENEGEVTFEFGVCRLQAGPAELLLRANAPDPASLDRLEQVIGSHLERFAHRDGITVEWSRDATN